MFYHTSQTFHGNFIDYPKPLYSYFLHFLTDFKRMEVMQFDNIYFLSTYVQAHFFNAPILIILFLLNFSGTHGCKKKLTVINSFGYLFIFLGCNFYSNWPVTTKFWYVIKLHRFVFQTKNSHRILDTFFTGTHKILPFTIFLKIPKRNWI